MEVYLVFHNDDLLGVYVNGPRAVARLNEVRNRTGLGWVRLPAFDDKNDPNVQRWNQRNANMLCVEKETVL